MMNDRQPSDQDPFLQELALWDFELPDRLIARHGLPQRDEARLLLVRTGKPLPEGPPENIALSEHRIADLPSLLDTDDLLIPNSTRVSKRRIFLRRKSGARLEALFLSPRPDDPASWLCLLKNQRKAKPEEILYIEQNNRQKRQAEPNGSPPFFRFTPLSELTEAGAANACLKALHPSNHKEAAWKSSHEAEAFFEKYGEIPLPPYLGRNAEKSDEERYQTIFAREQESVAAPTAGLHFTPAMLASLKSRGIRISPIHLQIGYGTFAPLTQAAWTSRRLHTENFSIPDTTAEALRTHKGRIIAIGTTSLRALESSYRSLLSTSSELARTERVRSGEQSTDLFLRPPDHPRSIDGLLTNFHLPKSSLLLLVGSILGRKNTLTCYEYAIRHEFRFFSYGDAMLILP